MQNRARTFVAALAIALGVALGLAVERVNESAVAELAHSVRMLSGDADLSVRGPRSGFDEHLYATISNDATVLLASPALEVDARVVTRDEPLRILGLDAFRTGAMQPALIGSTSDRLDTLRPDAIFLSQVALRELGVRVGERLTLRSGSREVEVRIAGTLVGAGQPRLGVMDIGAVQSAFDRGGVLTRIDVRLKPGAHASAARARIAATLPAGVSIDEPAASLRATERISRSYRVNLNVLALVALFTGTLLVFSTQALSVMRRRAQFALLRTLGMTRRRLAVLIAAEGALIGAVGSVVGLVAGHAIAAIAMRLVGPDLGSGYFRGVESGVDVDARSLVLFFVLGVVAATLGSVAPALEAARASPARALKAGDEEEALARVATTWPGIIVASIGLVLVVLPPIDDVPIFGYLAIACLLVGTLLLMPAIARRVLGAIPSPRSASPALALAQLRAAPGQVSTSLASIVASVSLMASMAIMVASFRDSLDAWLHEVLPAPLYARVGNGEPGFAVDDQVAIAALPGVARVEFIREEQLLLDASRPRVVLLARSLDEATFATRLPQVDTAPPRTANDPPPVWVNEAMVDLYGFRPGAVVRLPLGGKSASFYVAGVWRDYGRPQGAVQIQRDLYVALTGDRTATSAALWLESSAGLGAAREALLRSVHNGERLEIATPGEIRETALAAFDRTFAVTYAIEFAGVAIGLVGLSSAFGALVVARRREFGVLRHLGMTRRQIGAMLATEGVVTSTIGVVAGIALGFVVSLVLIHVVNRQSFHWGMELSVPFGALVAFTVTVIALATLTAVASGRQAMADDVVSAVKDDW